MLLHVLCFVPKSVEIRDWLVYAIVSGALVNSFFNESRNSSRPEREAPKYEIRMSKVVLWTPYPTGGSSVSKQVQAGCEI
jgi:hypothetical protein